MTGPKSRDPLSGKGVRVEGTTAVYQVVQIYRSSVNGKRYVLNWVDYRVLCAFYTVEEARAWVQKQPQPGLFKIDLKNLILLNDKYHVVSCASYKVPIGVEPSDDLGYTSAGFGKRQRK